MIKYLMAAAALKSFSISPEAKRIYRQLGNVIDQRRRIHEGLVNTAGDYIGRVRRMLAWCERYHAVHKDDRLLEIGTGWLHWESMILRLFYDVEITMFDIWDNRYFKVYKQYFGQLEKIIDKEIDIDPMQHERVHKLLQTVLKAKSFDEIYNLLGLRYVIEPSGSLKQFQDESFNFIFSCGVLQHIKRDMLPEVIQDSYRLLKPGGYSIHDIDLVDLLAYYDCKVSRKNYLRYSDKIWRRYFENQVQHHNKVQRPEWLDLFHKTGFELVEEEAISADIGTIKVDKSYQHLCKQDIECVTLRVVLRKPHQT